MPKFCLTARNANFSFMFRWRVFVFSTIIANCVEITRKGLIYDMTFESEVKVTYKNVSAVYDLKSEPLFHYLTECVHI